MQTYWLALSDQVRSSFVAKEGIRKEGTSSMPDFDLFGQSARNLSPEDDPKIKRLIDWNVESLARLMKQIVARRNAWNQASSESFGRPPSEEALDKGETFLDEVKEIIKLPKFDASLVRKQDDVESIVLPIDAVEELRDYVTCIASMYRDNPCKCLHLYIH